MHTNLNELPAGDDHPEIPTVVLQVEGGVVHCMRSDGPVHIIILDADIEGGDPENISLIDGNEVYVSEYLLTGQTSSEESEGIDVEFVENVLQQI